MRKVLGTGWMHRLIKRNEPAPQPGDVVCVDPSLAWLESRICDGIIHRSGTSSNARTESRRHQGTAPHNAFGAPVSEDHSSGASDAVGMATGLSLAGMRATAFVDGPSLLQAHASIQDTAQRLTPVVLHAYDVDSAVWHSLADAGPFLLWPQDGQAALDLSLLARWVSERAMLPGLIATSSGAVQNLDLPDDELIRSYLGEGASTIASPTPAQQILFGPERPLSQAWFDLDHPMASGGLRGAAEGSRARQGQHLFFRHHLTELINAGLASLEALTGRHQPWVVAEGLDRADLVLVAHGALLTTARAIAATWKEYGTGKVGVVGPQWLRPFPAEELAALLDGRKQVVVLEASEPGSTPLRRELAAACPGGGQNWVSLHTHSDQPDMGQLDTVLRSLLASPSTEARTLGSATPEIPDEFPRRQALLASLSNDYALYGNPPEQDRFLPEAGRTVTVIGREAELSGDLLHRVAQHLKSLAGPHVFGQSCRPEPGSWEARIHVSDQPFVNPGMGTLSDILCLASCEPRDLGNPFAKVRKAGTVLVSTNLPDEALRFEFAPAWRRAIAKRSLKVYRVPQSLEGLLDGLTALHQPSHDLVLVSGLAQDEPAGERDLPHVVERVGLPRTAPDSLPRFWGELVQSRQAGSEDDLPDPLTATGVAPACASALQPQPAVAHIPKLDPGKCTGCGLCWSRCPDSAFEATLIGGQALFDAASVEAGTSGQAADALRRAHKHVATRLARSMSEVDKGYLEGEACDATWAWLSSKLEIPQDQKVEYDAAFAVTAESACGLNPIVTRTFYGEQEEATKGSGEFLILAINPEACLGCATCVQACPEEALSRAERTPERVQHWSARWRRWERLPDTPGASIARAMEHPELDPLAGLLLSRHSAQAQVGGGGGEPGSGERLAGRLVAGVTEFHTQRKVVSLLERMNSLSDKLEASLESSLGKALATDPRELAETLSHGTSTSLAQKLDSLGGAPERAKLERQAKAAARLLQIKERILSGADGLGRARFGVVCAEGPLADWLARFPRNPYHAPLTLAPSSQGVELARGLARGLVTRYLDLLAVLDLAELAQQCPADIDKQITYIRNRSWSDLDPAQKAACPPLLVFGDESSLSGTPFALAGSIFHTDLPIKVVLFDGLGNLEGTANPTLMALAHRKAFVLSTSIAHGAHLVEGLCSALAHPGPAFVHLHTPSPLGHGFDTTETVQRALDAVDVRIHPLLRYDPRADGVFGLRMSLEGNPQEQPTLPNLILWAQGESRFDSQFAGEEPSELLLAWCQERLDTWQTFRELSGDAGPFTEPIRAALAKELQHDHESKLAATRTELEALRATDATEANQAAQSLLAQRLMDIIHNTPDEPEENESS